MLRFTIGDLWRDQDRTLPGVSRLKLSACVDGLGLGMFLSYQVAPLRKSGLLKYVLEQFEPEPIPVHVVYAHSTLHSNRMHAFVDECVETLRKTRFD